MNFIPYVFTIIGTIERIELGVWYQRFIFFCLKKVINFNIFGLSLQIN